MSSIGETKLILNIDKKWQEVWENRKCFEGEQKKGEKKYLTAAFPYPNSPQHIGHGRTYTITDVYARYLRLKGYNVLFPMGFHVTGTPIIAMAKRIAEKDENVLSVFEKIYGIPRAQAEKLTDPTQLVMYFSHEIEQGMKEIGFSIDWRRKFYSSDTHFNKFIQWQFRKLKEKGYIIKGNYPLAWCPKDNNAVSAHDTQGDVDPEVEEVVGIKFKSKDGDFIATTYRPETIFGVTNLWVNPLARYVRARRAGEKEPEEKKAEYKKSKIKEKKGKGKSRKEEKKSGEVYYMEKRCFEKLKEQLGLVFEKEFSGEYFVKKKFEAINPITKESIPVFPANFVKEGEGTGVVMSVPAHAPFDYIALRDINRLGRVKIIKIIETPNEKDPNAIPTEELVENMRVRDQTDIRCEEATNILYKKEAHEGAMLVKGYIGMPVMEAKEKIKEKMIKENDGIAVHIIANGPVFCRCGEEVVVNIVKDQWFIDYGNEEWKKKTVSCLNKMRIIPERVREEYEHTIEWLKRKPCARSSGLGTKFPFDESKIVEPLSDSTIYMAFYTIAHKLGEFDPHEINDAFFDFVFLGKGKGDERMKKLRAEFLYWYPLDSRHSGMDLTKNHLIFLIFNHVAIFEKELWPKQIVSNGFVLMDGKKMSKSMGNILPLRQAIRKYGSDVVRFSTVAGADLSQDTNFSQSVAEGMLHKLEYVRGLIERAKSGGHSRIDKWLESRLNQKILNAEKYYEELDLRSIGQELFYSVVSDLSWYEKRTGGNNSLRNFFKKWIVLISPILPHYAEEFNEILMEEGIVAEKKFPKAEKGKIDEVIELGEDLIRQVDSDTKKIVFLLGRKPTRVHIYCAAPWKTKVYAMLREYKDFDKVMSICAKDPQLRRRMEEIQIMLKHLIRNVHGLPGLKLTQKEEIAALVSGKGFFKKEFGCEFVIMEAEKGKHPKAINAIPMKPSIVIE